MDLGLVCDACDALSPLRSTECCGCSAPLGVAPFVPEVRQAPKHADPRRCAKCDQVAPAQFRFCGRCGAALPLGSEGALPARAVEIPGQPRLVHIRPDGTHGDAFVVGERLVAGRATGDLSFAGDLWMSPRHATFRYDDGRLHVRDEASLNGVFLRLQGARRVPSGTRFLVGEQLLTVEVCPTDRLALMDDSGTCFFGSPRSTAKLAIGQQLAGGQTGLYFRTLGTQLTIGREGNDINFPEDPFLSARHVVVQIVGDPQAPDPMIQVTDQGSRNGTFVRVRGEVALAPGDQLFLGQQLLQVEI